MSDEVKTIVESPKRQLQRDLAETKLRRELEEAAGVSAAALVERVPVAITPMDMLDRAVSQGADIEVLEKLMALQERWERNQARKAFDKAIAMAKSELKPIAKNREVTFEGRGGGRTSYRFEDLAEIEKAVVPVLSKYGLSYRFRTTAKPGEPIIIVTCIVSHEEGYAEENSLPGPADTSGSKNAIQAIGSTVTYLQRYTLKASLGLAASHDTDAQDVTDTGELISAEQLKSIHGHIVRTGSDINRFCKYMKIEKLEDMLAADYERAIAALENKARKS